MTADIRVGTLTEVMGVDDLGAGERHGEQQGHRLGRVAMQPGHRPEDADAQANVGSPRGGSQAKGDQLAGYFGQPGARASSRG